jgi:hypothetical protein
MSPLPLTERRSQLEAIAAIDRFVAARIERHLGNAATLVAGGRKHFAGTSTARAVATPAPGAAGAHSFASLPAIGTAVGLVLETFLLVKALFAGTENELAPAIDTVERFIYVHEASTP